MSSLPPIQQKLPARKPKATKGRPTFALATLNMLKRRQNSVKLKTNALKKVNVFKEQASYRVEKEMNLQHFRELMEHFQVSICHAVDGYFFRLTLEDRMLRKRGMCLAKKISRKLLAKFLATI
jgi:sRNA-binding carbon storage regulator CsrA